MRSIALLAVYVACLAACDDAPTKPLASPTPVKAPAKAVETPKTDPVLAKAFVPAPKDFLALATAKPHPALVGPFEPITLTPLSTIQQARKQAPYLFEKNRPGKLAGPFTFTSAEWPGLDFDVERMGQIDSEPDKWLVEYLRVVLPRDGVADRLKAAWGDPRIEGDRSIWLAPEIGLRADLHEERDYGGDKLALTLRGYTPLEMFIGTDPVLFGFEGGTPLLGAQGSALIRRFGRRIFDYDKIRMWPIERGDEIDVRFAASLELDEEDLPDHVVEWFSLEIGNDEAVSALLAKKFGKPRVDADDENVRVYRKSPRVTFDGHELVVGSAPEY